MGGWGWGALWRLATGGDALWRAGKSIAEQFVDPVGAVSRGKVLTFALQAPAASQSH